MRFKIHGTFKRENPIDEDPFRREIGIGTMTVIIKRWLIFTSAKRQFNYRCAPQGGSLHCRITSNGEVVFDEYLSPTSIPRIKEELGTKRESLRLRLVDTEGAHQLFPTANRAIAVLMPRFAAIMFNLWNGYGSLLSCARTEEDPVLKLLALKQALVDGVCRTYDLELANDTERSLIAEYCS